MFGIPLKFILIGLAALAIVAAIGGTIVAAKAYVQGLNDTITLQQEQIAGLEIDNVKLSISNESLESLILRKSQETKEAFEEITRLRILDAEADRRLHEIQVMLRDQDRAKRIDVIRNSRKASLLLRITNKNIKCWVEKFDRFNGKCVSGQWRENKE